MRRSILIVVTCAVCLEWTQITGKVKGVNHKNSTVTIENKEGNLFTIPIDYQVKITEKDGDIKSLSSLELNDKVTLTRTPSEPEPDQPDTFKQAVTPEPLNGEMK